MKTIACSRATALIAAALLAASSASAHPGHGPMENFNQGAAHTLAHLALPLVAGFILVAAASIYLLARSTRPPEKVRTRK